MVVGNSDVVEVVDELSDVVLVVEELEGIVDLR